MRKSTRKQGFTLREMFVIIAIIAVLLAILVPAVQKAREGARQAQSRNNLKQVGLSLWKYHDSAVSTKLQAGDGKPSLPGMQ